MAQPREHLTNAPIEEAVIDFRVVPREDTLATAFVPLKKQLEGDYPLSVPMRYVQARFAVKNSAALARDSIAL